MINHQGNTLESGHFVNYIKIDKNWLYFNNNRINKKNKGYSIKNEISTENEDCVCLTYELDDSD